MPTPTTSRTQPRRPTVHKLFCQSLRWRFPDYDQNTWGITASDSRLGYQIWGGPPEIGYPDGTVVPCAAGGSIPFLPQDTIACLTNLYNQHGLASWKRYGFVDAFNPLTGWTDFDVVGINLGITMLMAENHRTGFIWEHFMKNPRSAARHEAGGIPLKGRTLRCADSLEPSSPCRSRGLDLIRRLPNIED